jgi:hypothetical protein
MEQWFLLRTTLSYAEASIIKGVLEENQIPVQVLNQIDSSYVNFGDIKIYVPAHLQSLSEKLLGETLQN